MGLPRRAEAPPFIGDSIQCGVNCAKLGERGGSWLPSLHQSHDRQDPLELVRWDCLTSEFVTLYSFYGSRPSLRPEGSKRHD